MVRCKSSLSAPAAWSLGSDDFYLIKSSQFYEVVPILSPITNKFSEIRKLGQHQRASQNFNLISKSCVLNQYLMLFVCYKNILNFMTFMRCSGYSPWYNTERYRLDHCSNEVFFLIFILVGEQMIENDIKITGSKFRRIKNYKG